MLSAMVRKRILSRAAQSAIDPLDCVPETVFERLHSNPREIHAGHLTTRQVLLSSNEERIGTQLQLLRAGKQGYFTPNEWIQLLTHRSYYSGAAVNQQRFTDLGSDVLRYVVAMEILHPNPDQILAKSRYDQLTAEGMLWKCAETMGLRPIIRYTGEKQTRGMLVKTFFAIVGGIFQKAGLQEATLFIKRHLHF